MILQTAIVAFALAVAIGGFAFWFWIDAVILPRKTSHCLRYSLIGGILFSTACFASFTALVVLQSGQRLLGIGLVISLFIGMIVSIGMASPYWVTKKLEKKHRTGIAGGDNHV